MFPASFTFGCRGDSCTSLIVPALRGGTHMPVQLPTPVTFAFVSVTFCVTLMAPALNLSMQGYVLITLSGDVFEVVGSTQAQASHQ